MNLDQTGDNLLAPNKNIEARSIHRNADGLCLAVRNEVFCESKCYHFDYLPLGKFVSLRATHADFNGHRVVYVYLEVLRAGEYFSYNPMLEINT